MTVHLLKMAVGIDSLDHLARRQRERMDRALADGGTAELRHRTRNVPRRAAEILDGGGSIYWIIKGYIRARQRILAIDEVFNARGRRRCMLILDPEITPTVLRPHRAMQGWRYLDPAEAPPDLDGAPPAIGDIPADMAEELRALGLL